MIRAISIFTLIFILFSCSSAHKIIDDNYTKILFSTKSVALDGILIVVLKNSSKLYCNESNIIGVRLNNEIHNDLIMSFVGCVAMASKELENGYLSVRPLCNDLNKNHKLIIEQRLKNGNLKKIITFDLDETLFP